MPDDPLADNLASPSTPRPEPAFGFSPDLPARPARSPLGETLFDEPYLFEFFQAVRLLRRLSPGRAPVGGQAAPAHEVVRFIARVSMDFPPSAIHSLTRPEPTPLAGRSAASNLPVASKASGGGKKGSPPPVMETAFFGLVGAGGVLPEYYTDWLILEGRRGAATRDFLDIFHHRLVSLFYRAWEKFNVPSLWEDGENQPGGDVFTRRLFDMIGLSDRSLRERHAFPDIALLFYSGIFAQQHRSSVMLESLLRDYFRQPLEVQTFQGQWLTLPPDQQTRLGGSFSGLGIDTVIGANVWDDQSKFRVRIGPLTLKQFRAYLPGNALYDELMDLTRFYVRNELTFDVQLVLLARRVPPAQLTRRESSPFACQVGRSSWVKTRSFAHDADDAVFRGPEAPIGKRGERTLSEGPA